jgi:hypothetical protein
VPADPADCCHAPNAWGRSIVQTVVLLWLVPCALFCQQATPAPTHLIVPRGTPVRLRLAETVSSKHAYKGERLQFVVSDDVAVGGFTIIRAGAPAWGTISEVHGKRMLGIPAKLVLSPDTVELANGEQARLNAEMEFRGHLHVARMAAEMVATSLVFLPASPVFLLTRGSDCFALKSSEVTAYLNGNQEVAVDTLPAAGEHLAALDHMIDFLPPRVIDGHGREGDMVNLIFVASDAELREAFARAGWINVDQSKAKVAWHLFCHGTHYTHLPMAHFFLFGRAQDYSYALPDPLAIVARRHHLRIWKTDARVNGNPVWVAAATHDVSIDFRAYRLHITHRIDPHVDAERDFIAASLADTRLVARTEYVSAADPIYEATTNQGQTYYSDSRLLLVQLRQAGPESNTAVSAGDARPNVDARAKTAAFDVGSGEPNHSEKTTGIENGP